MNIEVKEFCGVEEYNKNAKETILPYEVTRRKTAKYRVELNKNQHPFLVAEEEFSLDTLNLGGPKKIVDFLNAKFHLNQRSQEEVYLVSFNNQFEVNGIFMVFRGVINRCLVSTRDIFQRALLSGGKSIAIIHNHPSTFIKPSEDDYKVCQKIKEAGILMDIELIDFIITGGENSYSFKANDEL